MASAPRRRDARHESRAARPGQEGASSPAGPRPSAPRGRWQRVARWAGVVFMLVVLSLVVLVARRVEWAEVFAALLRYRTPTLLAAAACVAASFLTYTSFDVLARRYAGHRLPVPPVMSVAFISYAFNLTLGNVIGGVGVRLRLYSRMGLDTPTISRVLAFAVSTNWLGYLLLAGLLFATQQAPLPPQWPLGRGAATVVGALAAGLALAYVVWCARATRRTLMLRGHDFELPEGRLAAAQLAVSALNWSLMGAAVTVLLHGRVAYPQVLSVLMLAAVAGILMRVPAGLGVLEGVFIALLAGRLPRSELLAALLAYRALYYLAPLLLAAAMYLYQEWRVRRVRGPRDESGGGPSRPARRHP